MTDRNMVLNDISNNQKEAMATVSEIFSALSKLDPEMESAVVLKIIGFAFQLASFLSPDPEAAMAASIRAIAKAVQEGFKELQAEDAANVIMNRATWINQNLQNTSDVLNDLEIAVNTPGLFEPGDLILKCQNGVSLFLHQQNDDLIWNISYSTADNQKIYWDDSDRTSTCYGYDPSHEKYNPDYDRAAYGPQLPPLNDDQRTVFEYRVSLPAFLAAVAALLAVGRALEPNFTRIMHQYLRKVKDRLQGIHDKIHSTGLISLSPPNWTEMDGLWHAACPDCGGYFGPRPPIELVYDIKPGHMPNPVGAILRYGAVEKFSGCSSMAERQIQDVDAADIRVFNKIRIRVLRRTKDVYVSTGLQIVQKMIDQLKTLLGDVTDSEAKFTDWSFQEVFRLAQLPTVGGAHSLKALADFLIRTQPFDTPYNPTSPNATVSFKQLLTDVPN